MVNWISIKTKTAPFSSYCRHVDPAALGPGLQAQLRQLDALRAFEESPAERLVLDDVPQEELPLHLEGVVEAALAGNFGQPVEELDRLSMSGFQTPRGVARVLGPAVAQAGDRGPVGPVDLEGQQVVAPHARAPRAVELADEAFVQFERGVGGVVGVHA